MLVGRRRGRGVCSCGSVCPPSLAAAVPLVNTHAATPSTEQGRPPQAYTRDASREQLISAPISTENFISEGEPTRAILDGFKHRTELPVRDILTSFI
ncbi:hypothetical protein AALO_G00190910 [Alosa alosa]|uniref:Uncharacterized protein n=1 Tax=Alosa alosa TaxID=278164 RepID=A0AAV6G586_9TELE|nr:hypothetical protein AALO_G00190910 [Alosa alosa]